MLGVAQTDSLSVGYVPRNNIIKLGGSSGLFSILSINYERVLNPELSVALTVSYMLPLQPEGLLNFETEELVIGGDRELTGFFLTPEVKWYLETSDPRPAPRGFYMGAYARFSNVKYTSQVGGARPARGSPAPGDRPHRNGFRYRCRLPAADDA